MYRYKSCLSRGIRVEEVDSYRDMSRCCYLGSKKWSGAGVRGL